MAQYRKKPVEVEAIQWNGNNFSEIENFTNGNVRYYSYYEKNEYGVNKNILVMKTRTLEGGMEVMKGDWVIKGTKGELYPCKADIFEATFERI